MQREYFIAKILKYDRRIGKDNKIYIADRQNYQIKIFSPKGKYISSFGRRGEGPGDFKRWFGEYDIGDDFNIYQVDFFGGNRSISIFDPDGNFTKRIKINLNVNFGVGQIQVLANDKFLIVMYKDNVKKRISNLMFLGSNIYFSLVDGKGNIIKNYFKEFEYHSFSVSERGGWPNIPFQVNLYSTFYKPQGIIAYQKNSDDRIHFFDISSQKKTSFKNGFDRVKITKKDIKYYINKWVTPIRSQQLFRDYYKKLMALGKTVEEYKPIISGMIFDAAGNLHVYSERQNDMYIATVISPKKGLLRKYQTKHTPALITGEKTYYLIMDDDEGIYNLVIK